jgi:2-keto-3-deoxy-L-rhamnonate aldolase RhmA
MNGRELKQKLKADEISIGAWSTSYDTTIAVVMARIGFDWVIVDQEHAPSNIESLRHVLWMFRDSATLPFVRVQDNRPDLIKVALDQGAHGVLVPLARSAEEARQAVASCKYPPDGIRGWGPMVVTNYGVDSGEYYANSNRDVFVMVQVEHLGLLNELDDVVKVAGLDALFIGPSDLSLSLGCFQQWDHPDFRSAVARVVEKARANGIAVGIAVDSFGPLDAAAEWIERHARGVQLLCTTEDADLLRIGGEAVLNDNLRRFG